jgi:RNA polymerase sigma-70 factor (ECF subfamily)
MISEDILKKAISGDKKSFETIYNEYFNLIWLYIFSRIKDREQASDIVSDSFISLYENIKFIKFPKAVKSYLFKIVKNKLIKYYSREKTVSLTDFDLDRLNINNITNSISKDSSKSFLKIEAILAKLPKVYEEVLRLRFLSGLKIKEAAEVLNKSENNIKVIQNRAIKKARCIVFILYKIKC